MRDGLTTKEDIEWASKLPDDGLGWEVTDQDLPYLFEKGVDCGPWLFIDAMLSTDREDGHSHDDANWYVEFRSAGINEHGDRIDYDKPVLLGKYKSLGRAKVATEEILVEMKLNRDPVGVPMTIKDGFGSITIVRVEPMRVVAVHSAWREGRASMVG